MSTVDSLRLPEKLQFIKQIDTTGKGTYFVGGREYTYYKLTFTIEAEDGKRFDWECCADAVNGSAQAAILGIGAALKAAREREQFKDAAVFEKALNGGEDGDPPLVLSYAATVETVSEETGAQKITYQLFEREHLHKGLRPLFKSIKKTEVTFNDDEIRALKRVAQYMDTKAQSTRKPKDAGVGGALEPVAEGVRVHLHEEETPTS